MSVMEGLLNANTEKRHGYTRALTSFAMIDLSCEGWLPIHLISSSRSSSQAVRYALCSFHHTPPSPAAQLGKTPISAGLLALGICVPTADPLSIALSCSPHGVTESEMVGKVQRVS